MKQFSFILLLLALLICMFCSPSATACPVTGGISGGFQAYGAPAFAAAAAPPVGCSCSGATTSGGTTDPFAFRASSTPSYSYGAHAFGFAAAPAFAFATPVRTRVFASGFHGGFFTPGAAVITPGAAVVVGGNRVIRARAVVVRPPVVRQRVIIRRR